MGVFDRFRKEQTTNPSENNPRGVSTESLLRVLASLSQDDIDNLVDIVRNQANSTNKDESMTQYLELVNQVFSNRSLDSFSDELSNREKRYEIYDEMDESTSYISAALDIVSDDAVQPDDQGRLLIIESESEKVKSIVEDLFEDLEVEEKLAKWARAIAKYGDLFIKVSAENKQGITGIDDTIYPSMVERKDYKGSLLAFVELDVGGTNLSGEYLPPWDYVHFRHKGDIYRSQRDRAVNGSKYYSLTSAYGQSILRPAIRVYAQLRFVENLLILSRLTNSIRRNIFLVNVGDVSPTEAYETVANYARLLKKDVSLDLEKGIFDSKKHSVKYDEDIFIPVSDPKNDVRIEQVGGDVNITEQYDLEYLLNKLFAALKIPKAYLNYEQDLNARSTLIQLDIRYARSVGQLQNTLVSGLMRLAKIHLAYRNIDPDSVDLHISLTNVSSIDLEARLEQKSKKMETAQTMWNIISGINDQLKSNDQSGEDKEFGMVGEQETPPAKDDNPIDMKYLADHILTNYFELSPEDVAKVLRKDEKKDESRSPLRESRKVVHPSADLKAMYPSEENLNLYEVTVKSLRKESESKSGRTPND